MKKKKTPSQAQTFAAKARELGCDENEAAFEEKLRRIAKPVPPKKAEKKKTPAK